MESAIPMLGWLIFAWGIGIIAITTFSAQGRVRSRARRTADVLSGLFFALGAMLLILINKGRTTEIVFAAAALVAGVASWILGRRARRLDRAARHARRR